MGVPGLLKRFRRYSDPIVFGCNDPECNECTSSIGAAKGNAIIDGPGLAYFIYYRLIAHMSPSLGAIDYQPSYHVLGRAVVAFLEELEAYGLTIDKIYFDGFLPQSKISTRHQRAENALKSQKIFKESHPGGFGLCRNDTAGSQVILKPPSLLLSRQIFTTRSTPAIFLGIPAASHLASAVRESLMDSKYSTVTKMVPGEADPYCARRARRKGGIVFTSDSDLLIYDLGKHGSVVYFSDLELHVRDGDDVSDVHVCIHANEFRPHAITQRLRLPDLVGLAYVMARHPSLEVPQIVSSYVLPVAGKPTNNVSQDFGDFRVPYIINLSRFKVSNFDGAHLKAYKTNRHFLDNRLSELVLQLASTGVDRATVYLEPPQEDTGRIAAWEASTSERTFAYSLLVRWGESHGLREKPVMEHGRKGNRFVSQLCNLEQWDSENRTRSARALELCSILEQERKSLRIQVPALYWRLIGLRLVLSWHHGEGKKLPSWSTVKNVATGNAEPHWSWEDYHLTAQIHAALYSLRIMKQIFAYIVAEQGKFKFSSQIDDLRKQLLDLPPMSGLFPSRIEIKNLSSSIGDRDWKKWLLDHERKYSGVAVST